MIDPATKPMLCDEVRRSLALVFLRLVDDRFSLSTVSIFFNSATFKANSSFNVLLVYVILSQIHSLHTLLALANVVYCVETEKQNHIHN